MNILDNIKDWYITKKTGLTKEERRVRAWYDERINYRASYVDEIYHGFDYIIEVDPFRVLDFGSPFGWHSLTDFQKYQYPKQPVEAAAFWAWVRGFRENSFGRRRYAHNEIGGGDNLFVMTNSKEIAVEVTAKYAGTTSPKFEDEISKLLAEEISREMDWEILKSIFETTGWHTITLINSTPNRTWLTENIHTPFHASPSLNQFVFQDSHEATMFALRWS